MAMKIHDPAAVSDARPHKVKKRWRLPPTKEILEFAELLYRGGICPNGCNRPEHLAARIVAGFELGLNPVQSINNIMIVSGRASIWGDAALALVVASGLLAHHDEFIEGDGDDRVGVCLVVRSGGEQRRFTFSVDQAKEAKLWAKAGPWSQYPDRMLKMRARSFALRDVFPDVLAGLNITEEVIDVEVPKSSAKPSHDATESQGQETLAIVGEPTQGPPVSVAGPVDSGAPITDSQLNCIANNRPSWARSRGVDSTDADAVGKLWKKYLHERFNITTARQLSASQADIVIAEMGEAAHSQQVKEIFGPVATT